MSVDVLAQVNVQSLKLAHGRARGAAGLFSLPLRQRVWRGGSGDFMGRGTGSSMDFQDHRAYSPGDDPRHINWQAYARTGQYSMKLFREEVRPVVDIILDGSPSMQLTAEKTNRILELTMFAWESALQSGAVAQVWVVTSRSATRVPPEALHSGAWGGFLTGSSETAPLLLQAIPLRALALRVLISDLLFPGSAEEMTGALAVRQGRGIILAPFCGEEAEPAWDGNMEFIDVENDGRHPRRVEPALLQRYRAAYARHFSLWKEAAQRHSVVMARVPSAVDLPAALQSEALRLGAVEPRV